MANPMKMPVTTSAATYQAASGAGAQNMRELLQQMGEAHLAAKDLLDDPPGMSAYDPWDAPTAISAVVSSALIRSTRRKTRSRFGARLEPLSHVELQLHQGGGAYGSDNHGDSWTEVKGNLPSDFGFPVDVHARRDDRLRYGGASTVAVEGLDRHQAAIAGPDIDPRQVADRALHATAIYYLLLGERHER